MTAIRAILTSAARAGFRPPMLPVGGAAVSVSVVASSIQSCWPRLGPTNSRQMSEKYAGMAPSESGGRHEGCRQPVGSAARVRY